MIIQPPRVFALFRPTSWKVSHFNFAAIKRRFIHRFIYNYGLADVKTGEADFNDFSSSFCSSELASRDEIA
jgi:hypothetical protein